MSSTRQTTVGVLGMATIDTLLRARQPKFEHDAVTTVDDVITSVGGKGLIAAIAARHAHPRVLPLALVGRESRVRHEVASSLDRRYLIEAVGEDHRVWMVAAETGEVATFVRWTLPPSEALDGLAEIARRFAENIDVLYVSIEHPVLVRHALEVAVARGIPIVANLCAPLIDELPDLLAEIARCSDAILCNQLEADRALAALGARGWSDVDAGKLEVVVVTAGADGGRYAERPFVEWTPYAPVPAAIVSAVGAGDTFNGQFVVSRFVHGLGLDAACTAAAERAAVVVARAQSSLPIEPQGGDVNE